MTVETNIFDQEEIHENCTVQILTNTNTGEVSIGWWENPAPEDYTDEIVHCCDCSIPHNKWTGCPKLGGLVTNWNFYCAFGTRKDKEK